MRCKTLLEFSPVVGETLQKPTNCLIKTILLCTNIASIQFLTIRYKTLLGFSPVVGEMLLWKQKPTNCMDLSVVSYYLQRELSIFDITVSAKRLQ